MKHIRFIFKKLIQGGFYRQCYRLQKSHVKKYLIIIKIGQLF